MNSYTILADSYRKLMLEGKIDKDTAEKEIRILEFLATCDENDKYLLIDSSAFNDIIRAFMSLSIKRAELGKKVEEEALEGLYRVFDEMTCQEVVMKYNESK